MASSHAYGDDAKADSLTVLPWTDSSLVFTAKDKRATLAYAQLSGSNIGFQVKASAPLDEDTRLAALSDDDHLVAGFSGSLQLGWDSRGDRLAALESATRAVAAAVEELSTIATAASVQNDFVSSKGIQPASTGRITAWFCEDQGMAADRCTQGNFDELLRKLCTAYFSAACTDHLTFPTVAAKFWRTNCNTGRHVPADKLTACAAAGVLGDQVVKNAAANVLEQILGDPDEVERIWTIYSYVAPEKSKACTQRHNSCIKDNAKEIANTIGNFVRTAPLERRDLLMFATQDRLDHALILALALSYDRSKIYQADISTKPVDAVAYDLQVGPDYTVYTPIKGLAANLRLGYERKQETGAKTFERCQQEPSADMTVTGKQCDSKALYRKGAAPDSANSVYIRAAVDYQYAGAPSKDKLVPGVELRGGIEGIGERRALETRLSLFGTPVRGDSAARVGVAIDLRYAIDRDANTRTWVVTPLVFVGAAFSDLMSR